MRLRRFVAAVGVVALLPTVAVAVGLPARADAQTSADDLRAELDRAARERLAAQRELERIRREKGDARARFQASERALAAARAELAAVEAALAGARAELDDAEAELADAEAAHAAVVEDVARAEEAWRTKADRLAARLRATFKYGRVSMVEVVVGSRGIDDLIVSSSYVSSVVDADRALVLEVEDLLDALDAERREATVLRARADEQRDRAAAAAAVLEEAAAAQERVTREVAAARAEHEATVRELEAEERAITAHLDALARSAAEIQRRLREAEGRDPGDVGSGWLRPTDGYVSSPFGYRVHPIYQTVRLHAGVDLSSPTGTPIRASRGGVVTFVGWMSGYGQTVIVYHGDGMGTLYAHLSAFSVAQDAYVAQGAVVGAVGMTGTATGPHLHFEVRQNGTPRDPCGYIRC